MLKRMKNNNDCFIVAASRLSKIKSAFLKLEALIFFNKEYVELKQAVFLKFVPAATYLNFVNLM